MLTFVIRRLFFAIPTLFAVMTLVFVLVRIVPGDPAQIPFNRARGHAPSASGSLTMLGDGVVEAAVEVVVVCEACDHGGVVHAV